MGGSLVYQQLFLAAPTPFVLQVISRMFRVTFSAGETVLEQDSLPTDDDCLYMLDTGEVDIVIAGSGEAANTNQEERKVLLHSSALSYSRSVVQGKLQIQGTVIQVAEAGTLPVQGIAFQSAAEHDQHTGHNSSS